MVHAGTTIMGADSTTGAPIRMLRDVPLITPTTFCCNATLNTDARLGLATLIMRSNVLVRRCRRQPGGRPQRTAAAAWRSWRPSATSGEGLDPALRKSRTGKPMLSNEPAIRDSGAHVVVTLRGELDNANAADLGGGGCSRRPWPVTRVSSRTCRS